MYQTAKHTHKQTLVKMMLEKAITASQVTHISNANQYFCELEQTGMCKSIWGKLGKAKVKFRFIPSDKIETVKSFFGILENAKNSNEIVPKLEEFSTTKKQLSGLENARG